MASEFLVNMWSTAYQYEKLHNKCAVVLWCQLDIASMNKNLSVFAVVLQTIIVPFQKFPVFLI
jgi:hypothetical protein